MKKNLTIGIISIGDELLNGNTLNTNAYTMSRMLQENGYITAWQRTLPDALESLIPALEQALQDADLLLLTGGLGPTHDDKTREVVAQLVNQELVLDKNLLEILKNRHQNFPAAIENQATVISGAEILQNPLGSAPGQRLNFNNTTIILLQGVPKEMEYMMQHEVLPWLAKNHPVTDSKIIKHLYLCNLSEGAISEQIREYSKAYPTVQIGIYPNLSLIHITLTAQQSEMAILESLKTKLLNHFKHQFYSYDDPDLSKLVLNLAKQNNIQFFIGESFTAGLLTESLFCTKTNCLIGSMVLPKTDKIIFKKTQDLINTKNTPVWSVFVSNEHHHSVEISIEFEDKSVSTTKIPLSKTGETARIGVAHKILAYLFYALKNKNLLTEF